MNTPPILFVVFNRPDVTRKAMAAIRKAKPKQLFVAGDGARQDRKGEQKSCELTREVATAVDWDCELQTLFRDENLGCGRAVGGAISWFFEHVEQGIILEDDCIPDPTFFSFCEHALDVYRDEAQVFAATGNNFQRGKRRTNSPYFFSKYPHCWGWATWRRAWDCYDFTMTAPEGMTDEEVIGHYAVSSEEMQYWTDIFEKTRLGNIDSWAFRWLYSCWKHRALVAMPESNLVQNIGFDENASHTTTSDWLSIPSEAFQDNGVRPEITHQVAADHYTFKTVYSRSLLSRLRKAARRLARGVRQE